VKDDGIEKRLAVTTCGLADPEPLVVPELELVVQ
jgi:hypothetical protein